MFKKQARLGWRPPLNENQLQTGELSEEEIMEQVERQLGDNDQEHSISPEDTKIGSQDNPRKFYSQEYSNIENGVMTPDLPKAKTSLFFQEMAVYYNVRTQWNSILPNANIHPVVALQLDALILSVYNNIRRALINDKKRMAMMDHRVRTISTGCQAIGRWVAVNNGDDVSILLDKKAGVWYFLFLNYIKDTWSELFDIMGEVDLGLHFEEEKEWKKKTKGKRGDLTRLISDKDAIRDEEIEERANIKLEKMLTKPSKKTGDKNGEERRTETEPASGEHGSADSPPDEGETGVDEGGDDVEVGEAELGQS